MAIGDSLAFLKYLLILVISSQVAKAVESISEYNEKKRVSCSKHNQNNYSSFVLMRTY